jgi:hypothetical protein
LLHEKQKAEEQEESKVVKWAILLSSLAIGLIVDYMLPGWGRPVVLTLLIFGAVLLFCRPYWGVPFWTVVIAGGPGVIHVPLWDLSNVGCRVPLDKNGCPLLLRSRVPRPRVEALSCAVRGSPGFSLVR